jgi:hypothetical protein
MRWNDEIVLLDLSTVRRYWQHCALSQNQTAFEAISSSIHQQIPGCLSLAVDHHPWRAVLLLSCMRERPTLKFLDGHSPIGRNLLHQISCDQWVECLRDLRIHIENDPSRNKGRTKPISLAAMTRTVQRMGLKQMNEFSDVDPSAMERRFGRLVATAWRWTLQSKAQGGGARSLFSDFFADDFPWCSIRPQETPTINRHFDHPIQLWDQIESNLRDDLDRICNLVCWQPSERVVSLEWELSFSCSPTLRIPVLFRHPHSLHSESGHHKTTLLQAFHSWQHALSKKAQSTKNFIADDSITEWKLSVIERMTIQPQHRSLFSEDLSTDASHLLRLENMLSVPLHSYEETQHWTPERAFSAGVLNFHNSLSHTSPHQLPQNAPSNEFPHKHIARTAMNQRRPLFIYDQPQTTSDREKSSGLIFSERVGIDWWSDIDLNRELNCRNYYMRMTDDGLIQWVYYTDDGTMKTHGIYG